MLLYIEESGNPVDMLTLSRPSQHVVRTWSSLPKLAQVTLLYTACIYDTLEYNETVTVCLWLSESYPPPHVTDTFFLGASSPLCWFNKEEFLCITHTVKHNYISASSRHYDIIARVYEL